MKKVFEKILASLNINGRDLPVFLLSLLLAFSIWLIHNLSLKYTEFLQIPVRVRCEIEGHSNMSSNTADVVARCQTTGYGVIRSSRQHSRNPLLLQVDPQVLHYKGGETFYMTPADLQEYTHIIFGENATVEYFLTDTLFFRFPFEKCKKVPVSPVHILRYAPQYIGIGDMTVEPDSVVLYGEPSHLENIDRVMTEAIRLNDINSNVHGTVRLERVSGVRMSSETVHYSQMVTRYFEVSSVVSIQKRNVPQDKELMVYPSTAEVLFRCVFPLPDDLTGTVRFYVDYNDFMKSLDGKCLVRTDRLPTDIISYEIRPKVFDCVVNEKL